MTKVYEAEAWQLDDLFAGFDDPALENSIARLEANSADFAGLRSELSAEMPAGRFVDIVSIYAGLVEQAMHLQGYASLRFSADTQDEQALGFMARVQQLLAGLDNQTMFFKLWWKMLKEEPAGRLLDAADEYRYWLEALRLERPHTLSEAEEKVINLKDVNGSAALMTLYDAITNRYTFKLTVDGEEREMTRGELQVFYRHPDPDMRAQAYRELYRVYEADMPILGQIYQYRVRDWRSENLDLRHYDAPIAVRNLRNDVPDEVVDTLLEVSRNNVHLFHRYFRLKARWLGTDKLRRYDLYAPMAKTDKEYSYDESVRLVLESFHLFDPHVAGLAQRVFDEHHLDGEVRKGKRSGAFCAGLTPDLPPWVLQSFQNRPDDVATMAHELGHAIHHMLSSEDNNILTLQPSLPLAETASTFAEMLVVDQILAGDPDPDLQRDLLFRQMDDAYATIIRQAYFAFFERKAHAEIAAGASPNQLADLYMANLQEQFGDSLAISDDFRYEWLAIPHIYQVPFYVYAYAFGQLLVFALYQQYRQEGDSFKPRYLQILRAGGSAAPVDTLSHAGIDVSAADFWQGGFDVIGRLLADLEALPIE